MSPRVAVVIPAGGAGRRMGGIRKQYLELLGEPVLLHTLRPFLEHPAVTYIVVALPADDAADPPPWLRALDPRLRLVAGGQERGDSVHRALDAVPDSVDVVLVHDAARPLITREVIDRTIRIAATGVGAVAAIPVTDTLKAVDDQAQVVATPDRARLRHAQTPQAFPRRLIVDAYRRAARDGVRGTDDASLVERYGGRVLVVEGSPENLKVTNPEDVIVAEALLRARTGAAW